MGCLPEWLAWDLNTVPNISAAYSDEALRMM